MLLLLLLLLPRQRKRRLLLAVSSLLLLWFLWSVTSWPQRGIVASADDKHGRSFGAWC